jgi:hypothetical protein
MADEDFDRLRPKVFGVKDSHLVGIIATTAEGRTSSVRFDHKYAHQLALQLLDMSEVVE